MGLFKALGLEEGKFGSSKFTQGEFTAKTEKILKAVDEIAEKEFRDAVISKMAEVVVQEFTYNQREKLVAMVDWVALTPTIQALATKELADQLFAKYRYR